MRHMLDPRSRILLKALVERYIADGEPVGSRTLSKQSGLEAFAGTIRNVMADLEELGFIASPHTSAGRCLHPALPLLCRYPAGDPPLQQIELREGRKHRFMGSPQD